MLILGCFGAGVLCYVYVLIVWPLGLVFLLGGFVLGYVVCLRVDLVCLVLSC